MSIDKMDEFEAIAVERILQTYFTPDTKGEDLPLVTRFWIQKGVEGMRSALMPILNEVEELVRVYAGGTGLTQDAQPVIEKLRTILEASRVEDS